MTLGGPLKYISYFCLLKLNNLVSLRVWAVLSGTLEALIFSNVNYSKKH